MNTIYIHKGDSTIFADVNKFLSFNINTELDLTGWKAVFMLGSVTKEVADISSKKFDIVLTQQETSKLWYGDCCACIKLIDANGNIKTVCNKIPFSITDQVVENNQEVVNLGIPNSCEIDIELVIGAPYDDAKAVKSVNGKTGVIELTAQDVGAIPDTVEIPTVVSQLGNDLNFATQGDVMQIIASIPQFNISIVSELPSKGQKMTIYLVAKEGSNGDVYNEYIWIEENSSYEFIGSTAVDLTDYVKNTDYATNTTAGVSRVNGAYGININSNNNSLYIVGATQAEINTGTSAYKPITPSNLDYAVKIGVVNNANELTDEEKTNAQTWLGLDDVVRNTDYATSSKAGIVRPANGLFTSGNTGALLISKASTAQIDAKTDNYYPIVPSNLNYAVNSVLPTKTQAEYEALVENNEIDANLFYMIVEE